MLPLTKKQIQKKKKKKICHICKTEYDEEFNQDKNYCKV